MSRIEQIEKERLKKLEKLRKLGINPYPYRFERNAIIEDVKKEKEGSSRVFKIAGRIKRIRNLGKIAFMDLEDENSSIQIVFKKDETKDFELLELLDIGDFLGISGTFFKTSAGELSLLVKEFEILAKSLLPLPEKWKGIKDPELKYRKRYLHLIAEKEAREVFKLRSQVVWEMRKFLNERGFIEMETPVLQPIYGGANARPFITHIHAKDAKMYLRISDELYLKRLIIGGYEKVFEIGKDFRNESIDTTHNPEFTMLELYWAYADYNDIRKLTEEMVAHIVKKVKGSCQIEYQGIKIDFEPPWKVLSMFDAIKKHLNIDVKNLSDKEILEIVEKNGLELKGRFNRGLAIAEIFDKLVQPKIIQPTFIIDYPKETTALCKLHRNNPELIERFEPFVAGIEIGNAYSELNDPLMQEIFFREEAKREKEGVEDAHKFDSDFIEALKYGMPPTGGLGIGIERLMMILANTNSIRDVILFPIMK
jgi:lysyl-tRNA synthetase class 2